MIKSHKTAALILMFTLIGVIAPARADLQKNRAQLGEFDQTRQVFSFRQGVITLDARAKVPVTADIFLDLPHGLGTNNPQLDRAFTGQGALVDLGLTPFRASVQIPKKGFKPALNLKELRSSHTYFVRLGTGDTYGQLHVLGIDMKREVIDFTWCKADQIIDDAAFFDLASCQERV